MRESEDLRTRDPEQQHLRDDVAGTPRGARALRWLGPGFIWMLSSVGSGSVLFTPRVGSRYGYAFLWLAILTAAFMWLMIREIGRYTVVSGRTVLDGWRTLPGPRNWAIWLIVLPQVVAAVVTVSGIAALAGSALMLALPGEQWMYAVGIIVVSIVLVVTGRYGRVEQVTVVMSAVLVAAAVVSAGRVLPPPGTVLAGLVPQGAEDLDPYFLLPWVGFILAGAAGIMWFSYWVAARGYGGDVTQDREHRQQRSREDDASRLRTWIRLMSAAAAVGVVGGALVIVAFLILGAELLAPEGIVPSGIDVAADLSRLLSEVWGPPGRWLLIVGIVVALWGTILSNQDGWGRMFADATLIVTGADQAANSSRRTRALRRVGGPFGADLTDRSTLTAWYAVGVTAILPLGVLAVVRNPVDILSVGGIVAAVHTPVVVALTLLLNRRHLPPEVRPGWLTTAGMVLAGLWYGGFAVIYLLSLVGIRLL